MNSEGKRGDKKRERRSQTKAVLKKEDEMLHDELVPKSDIAKFLSKYYGGSDEKNYCKLITPEIGKKSEIKAGGFDFSSLADLGINKSKVTNFMSKQTGKSFEQCYMELNMPPVNKFGKDSFGSLKTFSPGQMLSMRGFDCHLR